MDEARSENKNRLERMEQLNEIVHEVDDMTADGKVTEEEIKHLREKLRALEGIVAQKQAQ
jgi:hypothetical protein